MTIQLNGYVIEESEAEKILNSGFPEVYSIDDTDKNFFSLEDAQEYAREILDDLSGRGGSWLGDMCISKYRVNFRWNDDTYEYELIDEFGAVLEFANECWTLKNGAWVKSNS